MTTEPRPTVPHFDGTAGPVRAVLAMLHDQDRRPCNHTRRAEPGQEYDAPHVVGTCLDCGDLAAALFTEAGKPVPFPGGIAR